MFSAAASHSAASATDSTYVQLSPNAVPPLPIAYVAMTAVEMSRFG